MIVLGLPVELPGRDAFSAWVGTDPVVPMIVLSAGRDGGRRRMSLLHEASHLIFDDAVTGLSATVEKEADRFASAVLLPEAGVADELISPLSFEHLLHLKIRWGASIRSLVYRAAELDVISRRRAEQLFRQANQRWGATEEPGKIPLEKPRLLRLHIESLYGVPPNIRKLAADYDLPVHLARDVIAAHAARSEVRASIPTDRDGEANNLIHFPSGAAMPKSVTEDLGTAETSAPE